MPAMRFALVATGQQGTNMRLVRAGGAGWSCATPDEAVRRLVAGDVAVGRLDVLPGLDGIDGGLRSLGELEARGVRVLNPASALIAAHDKLVTARLLQGAGLPHPRTWCVTDGSRRPVLVGPTVVKPRFGSWGRDVFRCRSLDELEACIDEIGGRNWFRKDGAVVQELVPSAGFDLRVIVAAGVVVGAAERVARPGEWRTNVSLGGTLRAAVHLTAEARALAVAAAAALDADLIGVDLLPLSDGYTVIEMNGAVEFDGRYSLPGSNVYDEIVDALHLVRSRQDYGSALA
jgi:RimK family alpha-L-glutamate ligase